MNAIPDAKARKKALDPRRSFIVQAPAGSGKTELLIQRFLKLLGGVQAPEQILAMTFTRKAAAEMKNRISAALQDAEKGTPVDGGHERETRKLAQSALERNRALGWRLLENTSRLKVQTIDSFCLGLTRQMPILSQMGGPMGLEENAGELYQETARRILRLVESEDAIGESVRIILRHLDNSKSWFLKRVVQLLEKRDQWMIDFFEKFRIDENLKTRLEGTLQGLIESILNDAHELIPSEARAILPRLVSYSAENLTQGNPGHPNACLKNLKRLPDPEIEHIDQWRAIAKLLLTQKGEFRSQVKVNLGFPAGGSQIEQTMKSEFTNLLENLSGYYELREILREVQQLPQPGFTDYEWEVLKATLFLLPEIASTLREVFAEHGATDFTEISLSALQALGPEDDPTDLLLYLDEKIQHLLVDEFQDTSFKQLTLLKYLTAGWEPDDGRTLFIVGDPMQSIYRFRDAEVGLFLAIQRLGIHHMRLDSLQLKTNFRSQKKVVDWVNNCFSETFPPHDEEDLGAVSYSQSKAFHPADSLAGAVLHPVGGGGDRNSMDQEEAGEITQLVQELKDCHPDHTIAILVRARSHLAQIIQNFREAGITFKAEEIDPLTSRPAVLDLLALMRALLNPLDRAAWLSILRAPWCGMALADLNLLCGLDTSSSVWKLINDAERLSGLQEDSQRRIRRFVEIMEPALRSKSSTHFRDLLEGSWIALGGPACVEEADLRDIEIFFDAVEKAAQKGDPGLLQTFDQALRGIFVTPPCENNDTVHVMTMHKAKGLEFDFVILPGLGKAPRGEEKRLVHWLPHNEDLLLAPMEETGSAESQVYAFLSRLDRKKDRLETLRLLYVAATRARKQIHLFGHIKNSSHSPGPEKNSLLEKLWPYVKEKWEWELNSKDKEPGASEEIREDRTAYHRTRRLMEDFKIPEPPPDIETGTPAEISEREEDRPDFVWAGNRARSLGNVLHRLFKDIADQGLRWWSAASVETFRPYLNSALLGEGLPPDQIEGAVRDGVKALKNILEDATGRWILTGRAGAASELPITGFVDSRFIDRVIDRTFVDTEGVRWIIDFKTGRHEGAGLDGFFSQEKERYRAQLDQYERLMQLKGETRPIKKALYYPMHKRLIAID